jgi:glycosyltransferase involved in cell wall biosynthesis
LPEALDAIEGIQGRFLVVGEHRGGRWAAYAREKGLPVVMPGKLRDVLPAYWAADVLVYPSRYDAFGMAVLEAMACGLPVIVSDAAGSHEIVGDAGIVLNSLEPASIRDAIEGVREDSSHAGQMGRRARAIAETRTWDESGAMLLNLYLTR